MNTPVTDADLEELLNAEVKSTEEQLLKCMDVPSHVLAVFPASEDSRKFNAAFIVYSIPDDPDDRRHAMAALGNLVHTTLEVEAGGGPLLCIILVSDAYYVMMDDYSPLERNPSMLSHNTGLPAIQPSHHPKRKQCYVHSIVAMDGRVGCHVIPYERDKDEKPSRIIVDDVLHFEVQEYSDPPFWFSSGLVESFMRGYREGPDPDGEGFLFEGPL